MAWSPRALQMISCVFLVLLHIISVGATVGILPLPPLPLPPATALKSIIFLGPG